MTAALLGILMVFVLSIVRMPLAFAMGIVGVVGLGVLKSWDVAAITATQVVYDTGFAYTLSVVPLFILMGNFVARAGLAHELFHAAYVFVGHVRGGLAHATVIACAGFSSICGSSVASAATMAKVAYPAMRRQGYSNELSAGVISAGGTLGIMIPPSTVLVIYGIVTETSIGKLFAAGILPGLACTLLMMGAVAWVTWRNPLAGPPAEVTTWGERFRALRSVWSVALLALVVFGGIYGGIFTATEAAGIGASGAFMFALLRRSLTFGSLLTILVESARTTAMVFTILIGASIFSSFINFTSMPTDLRNWILQMNLAPMMVVATMMLIYVVLGTVMEELSMVLLTIPVFFPVVVSLGFDPVWFGVLIVLVVQIGLISPPVGMNLFVLRSLLKEVQIVEIFRGIWPFVGALIVALILCLVYQPFALWLPGFVQ